MPAGDGVRALLAALPGAPRDSCEAAPDDALLDAESTAPSSAPQHTASGDDDEAHWARQEQSIDTVYSALDEVEPQRAMAERQRVAAEGENKLLREKISRLERALADAKQANGAQASADEESMRMLGLLIDDGADVHDVPWTPPRSILPADRTCDSAFFGELQEIDASLLGRPRPEMLPCDKNAVSRLARALRDDVAAGRIADALRARRVDVNGTGHRWHLAETESLEVRLHLVTAKPGGEDIIHSHRSNFVSHLYSGAYTHSVYTIADGGEHYAFDRRADAVKVPETNKEGQTESEGGFTDFKFQKQEGHIRCSVAHEYQAGDAYWIDATTLHGVVDTRAGAETPSLTLFVKGRHSSGPTRVVAPEPDVPEELRRDFGKDLVLLGCGKEKVQAQMLALIQSS